MLKIEVVYDNTTQIVVPLSPSALPSWSNLNSLTFAAFQLEPTDTPSYFYEDEESDKVKISSEMELEEAYRFAQKLPQRTLHLELIGFYKRSQIPFQINPPQSQQQSVEEQQHPPFLSFSQMMNEQPDLLATVPQMFQSLIEQGAIQVSPNLQQSFQQLISCIPPERLADFTKTALSNSSISQSLVSSTISGKKREPVQHAALCDHCQKRIVGIRYKCIYCEDFDLCEECESLEGIHDENHVFIKITKKVPLPNISISRKVASPPVPHSPQNTVDENKLSSRLVKQSEISDIVVGTKFIRTWKLENNGPVSWSKGTHLSFVQGEQTLLSEPVAVPGIAPGQETEIPVEFTAPSQPGRYSVYLKLQTPTGHFFGQQLLLDVNVVEPDKLQECLQKLEEMGFNDKERNRALLEKFNGDVIRVVQEYI